jgi:hypothetical protein
MYLINVPNSFSFIFILNLGGFYFIKYLFRLHCKFNMNYIKTFFSSFRRKEEVLGRVESWETYVNGEWYHNRALVKENSDEIISKVDTHKMGTPAVGSEIGRVLETDDGKRTLLKQGVYREDSPLVKLYKALSQ